MSDTENGNGHAGGFMPWGRINQAEIIKRTEKDEIGAADARGLRVVILNVLIVLLCVLGIALTGQIAIVIATGVAIVVATLSVKGWFDNADRDYFVGGAYAQTVVVVIGAALLTLWIAFIPYELEWVMSWYPFRVLLPWWGIVLALIVIGAAFMGFRDLRLAHRRGLLNQNWPPVFQPVQLRDWVAFENGTLLDGDASPEEGESPEPEVYRVPEPMLVNNNGYKQVVQSLPPRPATARPKMIVKDDGRRYIWSPSGDYFPLTDILRFCQYAPHIGTGERAWLKSRGIQDGWHREHYRGIVLYLASIGVLSQPVGRRDTMFLPATGIEATKLVFDDINNPPTPLEGDENCSISEAVGQAEGRQADWGGEGG